MIDLKGYKKIAVMGGTFDPIHYGHLLAAETVRDRLDLDLVIFMPTGNPPHKQGANINDPRTRYVMTALAVAGNPYFTVSDYETKKESYCYSVETMGYLKELCDKGCKLYFITGADSVHDIPTWHKPEKLASLCEIVAVNRPHTKISDNMEETIEALEKEYKTHIHYVQIPSVDISSTDIRNRVFAGKSIAYLTPEVVCDYINAQELYRGKAVEVKGYDLCSIKKQLYSDLSSKRFLHTRGVAEEAVKLAELYGVDKGKAYVAGILHDCAKDFGREKSFELCKKYGVELDEVLSSQPDLIHSFLGSKVAEKLYGVKDRDILNAICYHTTGRENMSELEKIIYLADFFEPSRKPFEGMAELKRLAYENLDKAMDFALNQTISFNTKKNRLIHPLSTKAAKFYSEIKD